jgi:hypothetical protein
VAFSCALETRSLVGVPSFNSLMYPLISASSSSVNSGLAGDFWVVFLYLAISVSAVASVSFVCPTLT